MGIVMRIENSFTFFKTNKEMKYKLKVTFRDLYS